MSSRITVGTYVFDYCHSVEVDSSWQQLADTAVIELPNVGGQLDKLVRPGQEVKVELAYDDLFITEFQGFVTKVSPALPLRIECQDGIWKLKQETISKSWKSVTLKDVLKYVAPDAIVDKVPGMTLSPFRLDKVTRAAALDALRDLYGLAVYFRGPELFCGLPYSERDIPEHRYHFEKNCLVGNLAYRRAEDVKVKVKAISLLPDNKRIELELGDSQGETHTLHFYNLQKSELKQQAEEKLKRLQFDGYSGSFTAFGQPNPMHSCIVHLDSDKFPERKGSYLVDRVVTRYDQSGYRRTITVGPEATITTA